MIGAILDTATPLRKRLESALRPYQSPAAQKKSRPLHTDAPFSLGERLAPTWIATALSSAICIIAAAGAVAMFEAESGRRAIQFIEDHFPLATALFFGPQVILALAVFAYDNHNRRLKRLLSETQHYITYAVGGAEVGLWRWNAETGRLWLTDRAREILKIPPTMEPDPAELTALVEPDDLAALRNAIAVSSRSGASFDANVRLQGKGEEPTRWLRCQGRSQTDGEGRIIRIGGMLLDISERMTMQTEIDRQRQSLIHLSRVGTIGKLSGALAHELSQPLTAIMHNAHAIDRMLTQKPINIAEMRDAISDIIEDDARVNDVIRHLRALLKKDNADFRRVDMTFLVHKVLGLVRKEMALHRVKPVVAISPNFPPVWGDEVQLQQLLINLIMNAIDAIESNGKEGRVISITAYSSDGPGGTYHLCISDTGGGFKPGVTEKLFEPFFSTKDQGLGLGLSISQAIVSGHNGTIRAENNNEGGASFHITLPAAGETSA